MNSMTGFGRGEHHGGALSALVELSSVNRKQADVQILLPRSLNELESDIRKHVLNSISRGRITVSITLTAAANAEPVVELDHNKAQALEKAFAKLSETLDRNIQPLAGDFIGVPDIITISDNEISPDDASDVIHRALGLALTPFLEMRQNEGSDLKKDLLERLTILENLVSKIESLSPDVVTHYRTTLLRRLNEIGLEIDLNDERILREIALFAERSDISEEVTRLRAHFQRFRELSDSSEASGRPLDFLCQEINREFNTIGSKAHDSKIAQHVVTGKTELEKIREQVQNVE